MNMFQKQVLLVCVCFIVLMGQAVADALSDATQVYDAGDYEKAIKMYTPLAKEGNAEAQFTLGMMYRAGRGVEQDFNAANKWYLLASEQGHPIAQFYLGWMYAKGRGVPRDFVRSYMWIDVAIARVDNDVKKEFIADRDSMAKSMSVVQIAKAQELAKKCTSKKFKGC